jgi:hypothetical protein
VAYLRGRLLARGGNVEIDSKKVSLTWDEPMEGLSRPSWSCPLCSAVPGSYFSAVARPLAGGVSALTMLRVTADVRRRARRAPSGSFG